MREWFRAWIQQKHDEPAEFGDGKVRDYREYFKANLCVLEGAWISDDGKIDEPFASDRHHIEAESWNQLHDISRFLYNTGKKNDNENIPFLPSSVRGFNKNVGNGDWAPLMANFEYRIFCVPLKDHVPLARFRLKSDLSALLQQ